VYYQPGNEIDLRLSSVSQINIASSDCTVFKSSLKYVIRGKNSKSNCDCGETELYRLGRSRLDNTAVMIGSLLLLVGFSDWPRKSYKGATTPLWSPQ
jgi:hypothetical protein